LQPLNSALFLESNPIPVKWAVAQMGLIDPNLRLPLTDFGSNHHDALLQAMRSAGIEVK
ncbi:MAG: dihydrodipicolinate synthase family protein, partial [Pseudomonadota bacterium]